MNAIPYAGTPEHIRTAGNPTCHVAEQEQGQWDRKAAKLIGTLERELIAEREKLRVLREALTFIHEWQLPRAKARDWSEVNAGRTTEPTEFECSYGFAYGSNGERDYMKNVAGEAIAATEAKS